ncbi:EAL domain-containing protein [Lysobacter sp. GX 14042]|uniref:putative bifunctional diguanylate cyclase/phosphodiesterase n=1 Tax=Lysobacter sp. GX 14042 TaxID=2907155 RepID=UPI001F41DDBB|nr:EAL domain-containing protein [Lysobacter sp. GX 14042]
MKPAPPAPSSARVEPRFRDVVECLDQGIVVRDQRGRIVYANPAARRMFGQDVSPELPFPGTQPRWKFIDERGREVPGDALPSAIVLRTGEQAGPRVLGMFDREARTLGWVRVTAMPQGNGRNGRPRYVTTLYADVTGLKRDSALFARAQSLASIGGWEWDTGRDRLYLTREAKRILGRDPPPANRDALLACLVESDRRRLLQALEAAVERGRGFGLELQGSRGGGHPFWMRVMAEAEAHGPLSARITGTIQDITRQKQDEETLRVQARTDPLTGLLNRDAIRAELAERLGDPTQSALAVLYVDLDRFKIVNDVLGHSAGDRLLTAAARRIQAVVGSEGLMARLGGDEFLVVCSLADDPGRAVRMAEAILASFDASFRVEEEEFAVTASIGMAVAPQGGTSAQLMIQNADAAMYASKRRGRNGWQVFTPELAAEQQRRLQVETQLRNAVAHGEFHVVYQPQVDLATGRPVAAEALLRWNNPALGVMMPGEFIDLAENTGDVVGIGSWMLRQACRQLCRWRAQGLPLERIAVNVSFRQFLSGDLAEQVAGALAEFRLPGEALELELTERVLVEDAPETNAAFAALQALGVKLSIDDFGEGYSALNYLRRLPIHGLKISQLFVQGVPDNASDVAVCEAVIGIARSLRLGLVAEGVETAAHRDFLIGRGVRIGQGFLYAPGLPAEEFEARFGTAAPVT